MTRMYTKTLVIEHILLNYLYICQLIYSPPPLSQHHPRLIHCFYACQTTETFCENTLLPGLMNWSSNFEHISYENDFYILN